MKGIIVVDPEKCVACRTCELACAVEHSKSKELTKAIYERPVPRPKVKVESVEDMAMPLQCRHCEDAPCVKICPTKATERPDADGPVLIRKELCIGCKWCVLVCPFGVIYMDSDGKVVTKCDMCVERLKKGQKPACVQSCPTGALQFTSAEKVAAGKRKEHLVNYKKGNDLA